MEDEHADLIIGYLQGRLDAMQTEAFYDWMEANAQNKKLYFETKAIYDASISSSHPMDVEKGWRRLLNKKVSKQKGCYTLFYRIASYAAVALIAMLVTATLFIDHRSERLATHYVGGDGLEADVVILPDGTEVSLGSKTNFYYDADYGRSTRTVHLEGEAFFHVAKQKGKPFIVKAKGQEIEALGTKFNVMGYTSDSLLVTTLLEGRVRLTTDGQTETTVLQPDQQLVYNRNSRSVEVNSVDAEQFTSWTSGYYYFPCQNLEAILYRLSHVYGVTFDVQSEALNDKMFTGTFYRGQSVKNIMEIINLSIPIKYEIDDHKVVISE